MGVSPFSLSPQQPEILSLYNQRMDALGMTADVLSTEFLKAVFSNPHPSMDFHLVEGHDNLPLGCGICFLWRDTYYFWLAAYDTAVAPIGHAMYAHVLRQAAAYGARFIDAGRSHYDIKRRHGFIPEKLYAAGKSPTREGQVRLESWLTNLAERHRTTYPELRYFDRVSP